MTQFRPCIDIHAGRVKQIVGGTLDATKSLQTNFVSDKSPSWYAERYREDDLVGGHVIMLGQGNEAAATEAVTAWPNGLQLGGGMTPITAPSWLEKGAEKVIVTSYLFRDKQLDMSRVEEISRAVGPERLVIDLSCRKTAKGYFVATDRWRTVTDTPVNRETLHALAAYCSEYLVHAADVEGKCRGIDSEVVALLADASPLPCTYAGGANALDDLDTIERISSGRLDLTFGSALDIFGGATVRYRDCVKWNRQHRLHSVQQER